MEIEQKTLSSSRIASFGCAALLIVMLFWCGLSDTIYYFIPERPKSRDFAVETNLVEDNASAAISDITRAALYSFAHNRVEGVKPYFSQDLWGFLDSWESNHTALSDKCQFALEPLNGPSGGGSGPDYHLGLYYYICPDGTYSDVEVDLTFVQIGTELFVQSVNSYCESFDGEETCWVP